MRICCSSHWGWMRRCGRETLEWQDACAQGWHHGRPHARILDGNHTEEDDFSYIARMVSSLFKSFFLGKYLIICDVYERGILEICRMAMIVTTPSSKYVLDIIAIVQYNVFNIL